MFSSKKNRTGFTLVEIMIVVVIIGLLAAMAIPAFQRVRMSSRHSALANDFRVFAEAFESYSLEYGQFPADSNIGVIPPGVTATSSSLDLNSFAATTPIGGNYDWDYNVFGKFAAISVADATISDAELLAFDEKYDDGNLATGTYQGNTGRYSFILQL